MFLVVVAVMRSIFFRIFMMMKSRPRTRRLPSATPTPIPAFAPAERPLSMGGSGVGETVPVGGSGVGETGEVDETTVVGET